MIWLAFTGYRQRSEYGLSLDETIQTLVGQPGVIEWWDLYSSSFSADFQAHIAPLLDKPTPAT